VTAKHRRGLYRPKQISADNRYGVDLLDNSREEILPRYERDAAGDDPWLAPEKSEAVRALLILIESAETHQSDQIQESELDLRAFCEDAELSPRQAEVVMLAGEGWRVGAIASWLKISHQAVSLYLRNGRWKLSRRIPPMDILLRNLYSVRD